MEDLLGAMMSGAGEQSGEDEQDDDPLAGMLGSLMGGSGGGQAGGMESILGALMGGGSGSSMANNPLVAPLAEALSKKLGLSQEIAEMVVGFALSKLLSGLLGGSSESGRRGGGMESDQLLTQMRSGEGIDPGYLSSTGMTQELVDQTGLDPETAERSLQEAFTMLGTQMEPGAGPAPQQGPDMSQGLDGLLDSWEE